MIILLDVDTFLFLILNDFNKKNLYAPINLFLSPLLYESIIFCHEVKSSLVAFIFLAIDK